MRENEPKPNKEEQLDVNDSIRFLRREFEVMPQPNDLVSQRNIKLFAQRETLEEVLHYAQNEYFAPAIEYYGQLIDALEEKREKGTITRAEETKIAELKALQKVLFN